MAEFELNGTRRKRHGAEPTKKPSLDWAGRWFLEPVRDMIRIELAYQGHILKRLRDRQPRHVGHFLFKLINNINWIPRALFDFCCHLAGVVTKFSIQLIDLFLVSLLRGLWGFPWAVTSFFGLVLILFRIVCIMWVAGENMKASAFWTTLYILWLLWMSHVYIDKPETWVGYTRNPYPPFIAKPSDFVFGPYWPLWVAIGVFIHFECHPATGLEPLFLSTC